MNNNEKKQVWYSSKEIGVALNNAAVACSGSQDLKNLSDLRKKKLRNYSQAIIETILQRRKSGELSAAELVSVLAGCALFCHVTLVAGGGAGKLSYYTAMEEELRKDFKRER